MKNKGIVKKLFEGTKADPPFFDKKSVVDLYYKSLDVAFSKGVLIRHLDKILEEKLNGEVLSRPTINRIFAEIDARMIIILNNEEEIKNRVVGKVRGLIEGGIITGIELQKKSPCLTSILKIGTISSLIEEQKEEKEREIRLKTPIVQEKKTRVQGISYNDENWRKIKNLTGDKVKQRTYESLVAIQFIKNSALKECTELVQEAIAAKKSVILDQEILRGMAGTFQVLKLAQDITANQLALMLECVTEEGEEASDDITDHARITRAIESEQGQSASI